MKGGKHMKKKFVILFLIFYFFFGISALKGYAEESSDYLSYSEIMLSSGKLIRYYTQEEYEQLIKKTEGGYWMDILVIIDNKAVDGSYISNTLYSVENTSKTAIEYNLEYSIETNNKVSFQTSESLSASGGGTIKKVKVECAAKASIDYSTTTSTSVKEKRTMKLTIEPDSRLIVYLTGEVTVTNGVCAVYYWWVRAYVGAFEFVTLKSQFSKMEKRSI
jgi:hypothetical protein